MTVPETQPALEFDIIKTYFTDRQPKLPGDELGIGDDGAILTLAEAQASLVVVADTLVEDVHFLKGTNPLHLGHKALSVNLSDLAAMGAQPLWFTLCLTMEKFDQAWLANFSEGLFNLANLYGIHLVGGDTCQGPLNISIQAMGRVAADQGLRRSGAQIGDDIWVTGHLGEAALGLSLLQIKRLKVMNELIEQLALTSQQRETLILRHEKPLPRCEWANPLTQFASAAIDISDGFGQDLSHICQASQVCAQIDLCRLPVSDVVDLSSLSDHLQAQVLRLALSGGDDYELCFTAPSSKRDDILRLSSQIGQPASHVGTIVEGHGIQWINSERYAELDLERESLGYGHFQ